MKKIALMFLNMLLLVNTAFAADVTVQGFGIDRDSAMNDAKRNAVEQVVGTYIASESLVSQARIIEDEIYAKSYGFVKDIKVLNEKKGIDGYSVQAIVNVDTNPNTELRNKIEMIKWLGDPKIGVIVTYYGGERNKEKYIQMCESAMNEKLQSLGFNHVVYSETILGAKRITRGMAADSRILIPNDDLDYYVLAKLDVNTKNIALPNYADMMKPGTTKTVNTLLTKSYVDMNVNVISAHTGELVGSYRVENDSIQNNNDIAEIEAMKELGRKAAEQLKTKFSRKAAKVDTGMQIDVIAKDSAKALVLVKALQELDGVKDAKMASYANGHATINVDTNLKPQTIYRMLREESGLELEMLKINVDVMEIKVH